MDDSEDEVFMGPINDKEKQILLNQFRQFGKLADLRHNTDTVGPSHTLSEDERLNLNSENSCLEESGFEEENRTCMSDSEHVETDLNCTLDNVENLLAQGMKFMLTDDNGADITQFLPDGCNVFDSSKEKSLLEESNTASLATSNITIEYEQKTIDTLESVEQVDSFSSSETNMNDTLENVENLLSQGMKYIFTDENGMDVSHLLPDGGGIYDIDEDTKISSISHAINMQFNTESAKGNDIQYGKGKSETRILRPQNKCGSIIREYINENPTQLIANVKAKTRNPVMAKKKCVTKSKIVNGEAHHQNWTSKSAKKKCVVKSKIANGEAHHQNWTSKSRAVNINSPLPAVDYKSTVGLMLKNVPASPKAGSTPIVIRHLGRIRLPSQFRTSSSSDAEEVSLLLPSPVTKSNPRNNKWK